MDPAHLNLHVIEVAAPCTAVWSDMPGDDRVRHCGECKLNVYNLSGMTRERAADLVFHQEGRLCVRFFRRADGTILTSDCPVGLRALRRRAARLIAGVATMLATLSFSSWFVHCGRAQTSEGDAPNSPGPVARLINWIDPPVTYGFMGALVLPHITIEEEDESVLNDP